MSDSAAVPIGIVSFAFIVGALIGYHTDKPTEPAPEDGRAYRFVPAQPAHWVLATADTPTTPPEAAK